MFKLPDPVKSRSDQSMPPNIKGLKINNSNKINKRIVSDLEE